jgi:hypothetical protein
MDPASWKQVKLIVSDAMQRPAPERPDFVRERCPDPLMLAEALNLLGYGETESYAGRPEPADSFPRNELADLRSGMRIGQYEVLDRLGRGGMGQVFLCYDHELRRKVALKCLLSAGSSQAPERLRLRAEAQAAAAISHPNVAAVYHLVESGPRAFIVMEYVEGETLAARLRSGRLPIDEAVAFSRQLAAALRAAHARRVIHGDLKPGNIQVTSEGAVKVLDFGIAMMLGTVATVGGDVTTRTETPPRVPARPATGGTPPYMSPEQLRGWLVDERSDVFSLGVVMYEMATGRRPFEGSDPSAMMRAQETPAPPAAALAPGVPRGFSDVIARALELDIERRYRSAADLEAALDALQGRLKRTRADRLRSWWPALAIGIPVAVLLLGTLGVVKTFGFNNNFGRIGAHARFGVEPLAAYLRWGALGIAPKLVVMTILVAIAAALAMALRSLELVGPIGLLTGRVRERGRRLAAAMGLDQPATLAQALAAAGTVLVVVLVWYFADLIAAFQASFNSAPVETLLPMRESAKARGYYQLAFSVVTLILCAGGFKVLQLKRRQGTPIGAIPAASLCAVIAVTVLLNELPYRSFNYRDFERVEYASLRCYITGESGDEFLILCPATDPPRNRVVRKADPHLRRPGIIENVFRGFNPASPAR